MSENIKTLVGSTKREMDNKADLAAILRSGQLPANEILDNLGLFITRQNLSRIFLMKQLYEMIVPVHGVVFEFGVRWGQNMSLFSNLRGMIEPFNYNRRVIGFDTFAGFPETASQDGDLIGTGDYSVSEGWLETLRSVLDFHQGNAPIPHKEKYELVVGDVADTLPDYLVRHPETIVAFAYFDFDLYKPTREALTAIMPHVTKGTVLAFDELNCPEFPGETLAVKEVLGLSRHAIRRDPSNPLVSFIVID